MRFYPSAILTYDDLVQSKFINRFTNGHLSTIQDYRAMENYLGQPIVAIRQTPDMSETIIFMAPGKVYRDRITRKRIAVIDGTLDDIQCIISDMTNEYTSTSPWDIFSWYQYNCHPITDINALTDWSISLPNTPQNQIT